MECWVCGWLNAGCVDGWVWMARCVDGGVWMAGCEWLDVWMAECVHGWV